MIIKHPKKLTITLDSGLRIVAIVDSYFGEMPVALLGELHRELKEWYSAPASYKRPAPISDILVEDI